MEFTKEERESLKKMMLFLVRKKDKESGGHCGFHPMDFFPIMEELMEELVRENKIISRDTLNVRRYFLNKTN